MTLPKFSDLKFNDFGMIEVGRCKGRTVLAEHFFEAPFGSRPKTVKIVIEAEIVDVFGSFDGTGQEFTIRINNVKKGK